MKLSSKAAWAFIAISSLLVFAGIACDNGDDDDDEDEGPSAGGAPDRLADGVALFGYNQSDSTYFTQQLTDKLISGEMTRGFYGHKWDVMTYFTVDGEQFIMGHGNKSDGRYEYFIQQIHVSGEMGLETDRGSWAYKYNTLIPLMFADKTFIFAQDSSNDNWWFVQEIKSGGILGHETDHGTAAYFYDTITPIPLDKDDRACFFGHTIDDNDHYWITDCITTDGELWRKDSGHWGHGWQVATSYRAPDQTYLFGHRHDYHASDAHYYGPWFLARIDNAGGMDDTGFETGNGTWHNYYKTITHYYYPPNDRFYIVGENTDKYFFIQHVSHAGTMQSETYNDNWGRFYDYLAPVYLEPKYTQLDSWMGNMNSVIGDRTLFEIALPGSHDSAMNEDDKHNCYYGYSCNTVTQKGNVAYQLEKGSRYFDLRAMAHSSDDGFEWGLGHAAHVAGSNMGCMGEGWESVVDALDDFFSDDSHSQEVVILKLWNCMEYPGLGNDGSCSNTAKQTIAYQFADNLDMMGHLVKCTTSSTEDCDIRKKTVNEILAMGPDGKNGNIILVVQNIEDHERGIYQWGYSMDYGFYLHDSYSDTEDYDTMRDDQIDLMLDSANHAWDQGFLLSWTLTLSDTDASGCEKNILDLSAHAIPHLYAEIYELATSKDTSNQITKSLFPNILLVDAFVGNATRAAMFLNEYYDNLSD